MAIVICLLLAAILAVLVFGRPGTWRIDETALKNGVGNVLGVVLVVAFWSVATILVLRDMAHR